MSRHDPMVAEQPIKKKLWRQCYTPESMYCDYVSPEGLACPRPSHESGTSCFWHSECYKDEVDPAEFLDAMSFPYGLKLRGLYLGSLELRDLDLRYCQFSGAVFRGTQFHHCRMDWSLFQNCTVNEVQFLDCELLHAVMDSCEIRGLNFNNTVWDYGCIKDSTLESSSFAGLIAGGFHCHRLTARLVDFSNACFASADSVESRRYPEWNHCILIDCLFGGVRLNFFTWAACEFTRTDFLDCGFRRNYFHGCTFYGCAFHGAEQISQECFEQCELDAVSLQALKQACPEVKVQGDRL